MSPDCGLFWVSAGMLGSKNTKAASSRASAPASLSGRSHLRTEHTYTHTHVTVRMQTALFSSAKTSPPPFLNTCKCLLSTQWLLFFPFPHTHTCSAGSILTCNTQRCGPSIPLSTHIHTHSPGPAPAHPCPGTTRPSPLAASRS